MRDHISLGYWNFKNRINLIYLWFLGSENIISNQLIVLLIKSRLLILIDQPSNYFYANFIIY